MHILKIKRNPKLAIWGKNLAFPQKLHTIVVKVVHFSEKYLTLEALLQLGANPNFCYRD